MGRSKPAKAACANSVCNVSLHSVGRLFQPPQPATRSRTVKSFPLWPNAGALCDYALRANHDAGMHHKIIHLLNACNCYKRGCPIMFCFLIFGVQECGITLIPRRHVFDTRAACALHNSIGRIKRNFSNVFHWRSCCAGFSACSIFFPSSFRDQLAR